MALSKKAIWLSKIATREDAVKLIKDTSVAFFVVAGLLVVVSFVLDFSLLIDASIYGLGGFFLRRYNSRTAAVILLVLALAGAGVTLANMTGANLGGGNNIYLAVIILWAAVRAVEATFKLHGRFAADAQVQEVPGN